MKNHGKFSGEIPFGWFSNDEKPFFDGNETGGEEPETSDLVLIDVDGYRKTFITGVWHFDFKDEKGWWRVDEEYRSAINPEHMRWSYLPLARYDKK